MKNENDKKLAVYVVTYNRADLLRETIESVLSQTYSAFDLFVLDNCSTDRTEEMVAAIDDPRLHYVRHETNIGGLGNINYAIRACSADYFVIFHDDDVMLPSFLQTEIDILEREKDVIAVGGNAEIIGKRTAPQLFDYKDNCFFRGGEFLLRYLKTGDTLIFPSIMYRNDFLKRNHLEMRTEPGPCADLVLLADIERCGGTICQLPDVIMKYRIHDGQDTVRNYYSMHIKLFNFLGSDAYYKQLFRSEEMGREQKYDSFSKGIIRDWIYSDLQEGEAINCLEALKNSLQIRVTGRWHRLMIFLNRHVLLKRLFLIAMQVRAQSRKQNENS